MNPEQAWQTVLALLIYAGGATAIFVMVGVAAAMVWAAFTGGSASDGDQPDVNKDDQK